MPVDVRSDANPAGASIDLNSISHRFGKAVALDDISLSIRAGEFVAFLGPSGCGKTTLLRIVAGLLQATVGEVVIGGEPVGDRGPDERGVGIVFQSYALFPHMTIARNVEFGLRARGVAGRERRARVDQMLNFVRLTSLADRYPRQLSGGQQQRVALARALAVGPSVLLLDEPFGALDKNLRLDMQIEVKRIQRASGLTAIMVTHDQEEALSMADRIAVFNGGRLEQFGTPSEIYDRPASPFVSGFVGHTNLLRGLLCRSGDGLEIVLDAGVRIRTDQPSPCSWPGRVLTSIRPENLRVTHDGDGLPATVRAVMPLGATVAYDAALRDGTSVKVVQMRGAVPSAEPGQSIQLQIVDPTLCPVYVEPASPHGVPS